MSRLISYRDIVVGLRELDLGTDSKAIVHANLPALGELRGGVETLVGALTASCGTVVTPAFTYQCLVVPPDGPPDNGMDYGGDEAQNPHVEFFQADLPVHESLGPFAEALRRHPQALRSTHPVLSFAAVGQHAADIVAAQSAAEPWGPLAWLYDNGGDVLLIGAGHTANVTLHLAEKKAGRKQFIRWAVDENRAYRLEGFPGCSRGFDAIAPRLSWITQQAGLGEATIQRIPVRELVDTAVDTMRIDPAALLCSRDDCRLCSAVRASS
ncbi:MAG: AAC(3) family N-acetyltransferase [Thermoflexales bacterium]|nr:AAC(3) family N-acetyltransferase [Thermoflexales bacterium]